MKNNRREFLKRTGLAGIGLACASIIPAFASDKKHKVKSNPEKTQGNKRAQKFNLSGYAAPKLESVPRWFYWTWQQGTRSCVKY